MTRVKVTEKEFQRILEDVRARGGPTEAIQRTLRRGKFLRGLKDGLDGIDWGALQTALKEFMDRFPGAPGRDEIYSDMERALQDDARD
jgi:hypothetical protein